MVSIGPPRPPAEGRQSGRALTNFKLAGALLALGLVILATAVTVYAIFTASSSVTSNTFSTDTLDPPTGVQAVACGSSIALNWAGTVDAYAGSYKLLRATTPGGPYSEIATVSPATTTGYTDSTVTAGTAYYYALQSTAQNWLSGNSSEDSAKLITGKTTCSTPLADSYVQDDQSASNFGTATLMDVQPAGDTPSFTSVADSYVNEDDANKNYDNDSDMRVKADNNKVKRSFVQFDLSSIASGATVSSATLTLCTTKVQNGRIHELRAVTENWVENTITWNNQPAASASVTDTITVPGSTGCLTWTVTSDVQAWIDGTANYGWRVNDQNEGTNSGDVEYRTRENGTTSERPKLDVIFSGSTRRSFLRFDVSTIPAASDIIYATLTTCATAVPGATRTYEVRPASATWGETTITWDNQPAVAAVTATATTPAAVGCISWDVTADVQAWVDGTSTNDGWRISDPTDSAVQHLGQFRTRENSVVAERPALAIRHIPSEAQALTSIADSFAQEDASASNFGTDTLMDVQSYSTPQSTSLGSVADSFIQQDDDRVFTSTADSYVQEDSSTSNFGTATLMDVQPGGTLSFTSVADSQVKEDNPTSNEGTKTSMEVKSFVGPPVKNARSFAQFDISSIPAGSTVSSATLTLCATSVPAATRTYEAHRVTASWVETTITWNTQPAVAAAATDSATTPGAVGCMTWTVTADVQAWVDGTANYGWRIWDTVEGFATEYKTKFRSREDTAVPAEQPKLDVVLSSSSIRRSFASFDVSSIAAGSTVSSATLTLCATAVPAATRTHEVHRVTASWVETTITWANQPAVAGAAIDSASTPATPGCMSWTVTADVQAWVDGTANNGWRISDPTGGTAQHLSQFRTREEAVVTSERPKLEVTLVSTSNFGTATLMDARSFATALTTASFTSVADSYVMQDDANKNFDTATDMRVKADKNKINRSFMQFDLSSIAAGSNINSATLTLCTTKVQNGRIHELRSVTGSWVESTVTWNNQPAASASVTDTITVPGSNGCLSWSVTADVQAWIDGTANYGWRINDQNEGTNSGDVKYRTREEAVVTSERPKLDVTYALAADSRNRRSLVQFDVSTIPASSIVNSATLTLCATAVPAATRTYALRRVTAAWVETSVTWANQPTIGGVSATTTTPAVPGCMTWTVTADVQAWVDGTANNGWRISDANESSTIDYLAQFRTREEAVVTGERPKLDITFTTPTDRFNRRAFVQFDVSSIAAGSTIKTATLTLCATAVPAATRTYGVHQVTATWVETTITWANQPTVAGAVTAATTTPGSPGCMSWNVATNVQAWVDGTANNGWRIGDATESSTTQYLAQFRTREEAVVTSERPKLDISFTPPETEDFAAIADSYGQEDSSTSNFGTATVMDVQSFNPGSAQNRRSFVSFDVSSIPAGSTITSASLTLCATAVPTATRTHDVRRVTATWGETTITWANQPAVAGVSASATTPGAPGCMSWTVTADVQAWVDGTANNGWRVSDASEGSTTQYLAQFRTREEAVVTSERPKLDITFTPP